MFSPNTFACYCIGWISWLLRNPFLLLLDFCTVTVLHQLRVVCFWGIKITHIIFTFYKARKIFLSQNAVVFWKPHLPLHTQVFLGGTWFYVLIILKVSFPERKAKVAMFPLAEEILTANSKTDYKHKDQPYFDLVQWLWPVLAQNASHDELENLHEYCI